MPKAPPNPDGFDCVVVGAGLAGLICLQALIDSPSAARIRTVHVIEAASGVGGRLVASEPPPSAPKLTGGSRSRALTLSTAKPGIDLGAAWSWTNDKHVRKLARELDIDTLEQGWEGKIITLERGHKYVEDAKFGESPCGAGAVRFLNGGAAQITEKLYSEIQELRASNKIEWHFNTSLSALGAVAESDEMEVLLSDDSILTCLAVVLCVPPAAAACIEMHPQMSPQKLNASKSCQTWMSAVLKFSVQYDSAFWEDDKLSGYGMIHFEYDDESHIVECVWDNTGENT